MNPITNLSAVELAARRDELQKAYDGYKAQNLKLVMSRG